MTMTTTKVMTYHFGIIVTTIVVVVGVLCCLGGCNADSSKAPKVKDLTYVTKTGSLLDTSIGFLEFTVEADQDLYLTEGIPCKQTCYGSSKKKNNKEVSACDFSFPNSRCGDNTNDFCDAFKSSYCDQPYSWRRVELNDDDQPSHITGVEDEPQFYRFYVSQPCEALQIKFTLHYGDISWFLTDDPAIPSIHHYNLYRSKLASYNKPVTVCPSSGYFRLGTWTLGVYSIGKSNYSLQLESLDLKQWTNPPKQAKAGKCNFQNATCLTADAPSIVNFVATPKLQSVNLVYSHKEKGCQEVHIWTELITSTNSSASTRQASPANGLPLWFVTYSLTPESVSPQMLFTAQRPYLLQGADAFVSVCREGNSPAALYLSLWSSFSATFSVVIETDQKSWKRREITSLYDNPYNDMPLLMGGAKLSCNDAEENEWSCDPSNFFYSGNSGCYVFFPFLDNPFFQLPYILHTALLTTQTTVYQRIENSFITGEAYLNDNKVFSYALFAFVDKFRYVEPKTIDRMSNKCWFEFNSLSPISNIDGKRLSGKVQPRKVEPKCTKEVRQISRKVDSILSQLLDATAYEQAITARYEVDKLVLRDSWFGCEAYLEDYLSVAASKEVRYKSIQCIAEYGTKEYDNDPCCSIDKSWTGCCSPDRQIEVPVNEYKRTEYPNSCYSPSCVSGLLDRYAFFESVGDNPLSCTTDYNPFIAPLILALVASEKCRNAAFGANFTATSCLYDEDCVSGSCDVVSRKCYHTKASDQYFWECFEENVMSQKLAETLYGIGTSRKSATEMLRKDVTVDDQCYNDYGPDVKQSTFERASAWPMCEVKDTFNCLDSQCTIPARFGKEEFYGRVFDNCAFQYFYKPKDTSYCKDNKVCKWNPSIKTEEQCESQGNSSAAFICAVCGGERCVIDPTSTTKEACESRFACFHADGSFTFTSSEAACNNTFRCNGICGFGPCFTKDQCEGSGFCTGFELFTFVQKANNLPRLPFQVCVSELNPNNSPDCYGTSIQSSHPSISTPFALGCVSLYQKDSCDAVNGTLLALPASQAACSAMGEGCIAGANSLLLAPKSKDDCELCQRAILPKSFWIPGSWQHSVPKRLKWQEKRFESATELIKGPDFVKIMNTLIDGQIFDFIVMLQTQSYCRNAARKTYIEAVSCACMDFEDDSNDCFDIPTATLGAARVCPKSSSTVSAVPAYLYFNGEDIVGNECATITLSLVTPSTFLNVPDRGVSATFVHEKYDGGVTESVKNDHDTIVGEIISDGVKFETLRGSFENTVTEFMLCIHVNIEDKVKYKVFDFGTKRDSDSVIPLDTNAFYDAAEGTLCANITSDIIKNVRGGYYIPIARDENWEDEDYRDLTAGEQATLLIVASLFILTTAAGVFTLYSAIQLSGTIIQNDSAMIIKICTFTLTITCLIRFMYFILSGTEAVYFVDYHIAEEILVELPSFTYAIAFTLVAIAFLYTAVGIKKQKTLSLNRYVWLPFGILTVSLLSFFAIVIGVLEYFYRNAITYEYCGNTIVSATRNDSINNFRVAYRAVLAAYFILVSLILFGVGYYLAKVADSKKLKQPLRMLFLVGTVGCCSLLSAILFIIYYLAIDPTPYWTWVLLVTEILPCIVIFIHMIGPKKLRSLRFTSSKGALTPSPSRSNTSSSTPRST